MNMKTHLYITIRTKSDVSKIMFKKSLLLTHVITVNNMCLKSTRKFKKYIYMFYSPSNR